MKSVNNKKDYLKSLIVMDKIGFKIKNFFKKLIPTVKELHTIIDHKNIISSLTLLNDGRLASSSIDGTIKIFNLSTYKCELTINKQMIEYPYISLLQNGNILTCSSEGDIYIYSITKCTFELVHKFSSAHTEGQWNSKWISVVKEISNNRIASGANDKTIKIWNSNEPYNCIATLKGHNFSVCAILQLKGQELLVSSSKERTLRIWSLITYQCITVINNVQCYDTGGMMEIKGNRVLVGGESTITVVDIGKLRIEKTIHDPLINTLYSVCYLNNDKYIFGNQKGDFIVYNEAKNSVVRKIEKAHFECILFILRISDKMIASCSQDRTIKIWSI